MGKIRVKTIGIDEEENKEQKKIKERNVAKKAEAAKRLAEKNAASNAAAAKPSKEDKKEISENQLGNQRKSEGDSQEKPKKTSKYKAKKSKKTNAHSASYLAMAKQIDKNKKYQISEALKILNSQKRLKFDETIELHINTHEKGVSGSLTLPHGTGKKTKIEIADHSADPKHVEKLIDSITAGQIDFDILVATPETMVHLAKVARFLGPRGLMPNPKNGTVHAKPLEAAKKFEGGQINFKTEAKASIIHLSVGKLSFDEKQLVENIKAILQAIQPKNIKNVTLKSTMSPGIKLITSA